MIRRRHDPNDYGPHRWPGVVTVAFWFWWAAVALLLTAGMIAVSVSAATIRAAAPPTATAEEVLRFTIVYRGAGVVCALLGVVLGYLVRRIRHGHSRFFRRTVVLSSASVVLIVVFEIIVGLPLPALIATLALMTAVAMAMQPDARDWLKGNQGPRRGE